MNIYTYSEARQNLARLLDEAEGTGEVWIRRKDGSTFKLTPVTVPDSPFAAVQGVQIGISRDEIIALVRESREG